MEIAIVEGFLVECPGDIAPCHVAEALRLNLFFE